MGELSHYERMQIDSALDRRDVAVEPGVGLALIPDTVSFSIIHDVAIQPAMRRNDLNVLSLQRVFDSDAVLSVVHQWLMSAEVVVADVTGLNPHVMYALGLAHGLRRCPMMIAQGSVDLPFNLQSLRCIEYADTREGLHALREYLERAIRVFLAAARAKDPRNE